MEEKIDCSDPKNKKIPKLKLKYFSLFTGIGGFELGIQRATNNKWKGVGYSEIDKYAIQTFEKHFPEVKNYGDATKIKTDELPEFDMLCGGFPCQAFSIAGKRRGFKDTRGTLFFEIARIAKAKRPSYLLLENVKGLLNHEKGKTFRKIIQTISELGYNVQWMVFNSKFFGVPQNRERVFIIGNLRGKPSKKIFPIREDAKEISRVSKREAISLALRNKNRSKHQNKDGEEYGDYKKDYQFEEQKEGVSYTVKGATNEFMVYDRKGFDSRTKGFREKQGESPTLSKKMGTGGNNVPMVIGSVKSKTAKGTNSRSWVHSPKGIIGALNATEYKQPKIVSETVTQAFGRRGCNKEEMTSTEKIAKTLHEFKHGTHHHFSMELPKKLGLLRRLTPMECERLQGFPDNWTAEGINEKGEIVKISDTQRYKMCGNAVTTNVIEAIIKQIK